MRRVALAVGLGVVFVTGCNNVPWKRGPVQQEGLTVSSTNPTAESLVAALNDNAQRVQTLECPSMVMDCRQGNETATLAAMMVCQPRQRNFRMSGKVVGSQEVDLGSNNQEFWFWIKRAPEPYLFHCSHEDFARGGAAQMPFPFQPDWVIEALGIAEFDPAKKYSLVNYQDKTTMDLVEQTVSPQGQPVRKVTRLKLGQKHCQVTAHLLQDASGKDICAAYIREVQQDRTSGAMLPRVVDLRWPGQQIQMKMTLERIVVNNTLDPQRVTALFTRPSLSGVQTYDLAHGPDTAGGSLRQAGGTYR